MRVSSVLICSAEYYAIPVRDKLFQTNSLLWRELNFVRKYMSMFDERQMRFLLEIFRSSCMMQNTDAIVFSSFTFPGNTFYSTEAHFWLYFPCNLEIVIMQQGTHMLQNMQPIINVCWDTFINPYCFEAGKLELFKWNIFLLYIWAHMGSEKWFQLARCV